MGAPSSIWHLWLVKKSSFEVERNIRNTTIFMKECREQSIDAPITDDSWPTDFNM